MLRDRLIFLFSILQSYSQGGMVIVLTSPLLFLSKDYHSSLTDRGTWVSNPISYPNLRFSASIINGKWLSPWVFHLGSTDIDPLLSIIQFNLYLILAFYEFYLRSIKVKTTKSSLQTLYACLRWLTFAFLALPSLLAPTFDNTISKVISLFSLTTSLVLNTNDFS